jgi:5-hydroxyisourate hydrolase-like protein (transthyretin family)
LLQQTQQLLYMYDELKIKSKKTIQDYKNTVKSKEADMDGRIKKELEQREEMTRQVRQAFEEK